MAYIYISISKKLVQNKKESINLINPKIVSWNTIANYNIIGLGRAMTLWLPLISRSQQITQVLLQKIAANRKRI